MSTHSDPIGLRRAVLVALVVATFGVASLPMADANAGVAIAVPSVGEIVVDSYDCETGELAFHVPVDNLFSIPLNVKNFWEFPLVYSHAGLYGPNADQMDVADRFVWTPIPAQSPYSGIVNLEGVVSPDHNGEEIVGVKIFVYVGPPGGHTVNNPADSSFLWNHPVACDPADDDLVSQLVALLIQILQDILNG